MKNILEIDSVILEFGNKRILQNVYLKIETGSITGLFGRNGSGKTCLMNIIYGKLIPAEKSVRLNNKYNPRKHFSKEILTYLPQFNFIPKSLTIERIFKDYKIDFSNFLIYFPEFEKYYKSKIKLLSGGEQRIIEIYVILLSDTKFCMLDEPFSQVMPKHIETIKKIIINEKDKKGIIITDHLFEHIIDICNEIYVINNGTTILIKDIDEIEKLGYARITATNKKYSAFGR
ncbi:MAG: ATP-binding cassette domain-containing protein [Bacteroidales bacterium]|nr:ATP-binding cassette domain-containing protein [Bacteroidales bacterium]